MAPTSLTGFFAFALACLAEGWAESWPERALTVTARISARPAKSNLPDFFFTEALLCGFRLTFLPAAAKPPSRFTRRTGRPSGKDCRKSLSQESLSGDHLRQQKHPALKLFLKITEVQIVTRAGNFSQLPFRPQFIVKDRGPGFHQGLGIFHGDSQFQVVEIYAMETLGNVQLIAVRMAEPVEPGLVVKSDGIHDQRRISLPMADGTSHPKRVRVFGKCTAIRINAAHGVI